MKRGVGQRCLPRLAFATLVMILMGTTWPNGQTALSDIVLEVPQSPCGVPAAVRKLTMLLEIPFGLELPPLPCEAPAPPVERLALGGLSLRQALDAIVAFDPRYAWMEQAGVIVLRPVVAWNSPDHFLHVRRQSLRFSNQRIAGARSALGRLFGGRTVGSDRSVPNGTPQSEQRFSVALESPTGLEALNAVVRSHGRLRWEVWYRLPEVRLENADLRLFTIDGRGVGAPAVMQRDASGRAYSPCPAR